MKADLDWIKKLIKDHWGDEITVSRGKVYRPDELPGFIAVNPEGGQIGLVTYSIHQKECEIITLNSLTPNRGVGAALVSSVRAKALDAGCSRLFLITSNDNLKAINFYQQWGFRLVKIHYGAVNLSRKIKPSIPVTSPDGIPIQDEIEFEISFD